MNPVDVLSGEHLPKKCPRIGIDRLSGSGPSLSITGDPFFLNAYHPGDEYIACDYDQPSGTLSLIIRGRTEGPLYYGGWSCLDLIQDQINPEGLPEIRSRRIIRNGIHFTHTLLTSIQRRDGTGMIEQVHLETPRVIDGKSRWNVWEKETGDARPGCFTQQVDGLFQVHIGKQSEQCLRWVRLRANRDNMFEEADEAFISVRSGLTILLRHYIGKDWPRLDKLKRSPKMEIRGQIFYLWFVRRVFRNGI
ncbi:hypothetical protein JXA40_11965 [bacterium]|nr:hypothetical protein [candidate division CSSED10-310 bacterium]